LVPRISLCNWRPAFTGISNDYSAVLPAVFGSSGILQTRAGWTVGGGLEYAVTNNWSVRAEYRYSDFGRYTDFPFAGVPIAPAVFQATLGHHLTENQSGRLQLQIRHMAASTARRQILSQRFPG
jgi:opacity protein-like surface antigen